MTEQGLKTKARYEEVKALILGGMKPQEACEKVGEISYATYYSYRTADDNPAKAPYVKPGPREPHPKRSYKPSTSFVIPLAQNTAPSPKTAPPSTGKIAVIVCEADQLNNILQGLGR